MFQKTCGKLDGVQRLLTTTDSYVRKFDALSLSGIDINSDKNDLPKMVGLQAFVTSITDILNETYIEQQQYLIGLATDISCCDTMSKSFMKNGNKEQLIEIEDSNDSGPIKELTKAKNPKETYTDEQIHILNTQLRPKLREAYAAVSTMMDRKYAMLQQVQSMVDYFTAAIVAAAENGGVQWASERFQGIASSLFAQLLHHRVFDTKEERALQRRVQAVWATVVLGDPSHGDLAERGLAKDFFKHNSPSAAWTQRAKSGAVLVLLLWATAECFSNERSQPGIWKDPTFAIFMCLGDLLLLLLMWGVSLQVWARSGIDFVSLLGIEDTDIAAAKDPHVVVYASVTHMSLVFLGTFIAFNRTIHGSYGAKNATNIYLGVAHALPVGLLLYFVYRAVTPWATRELWLHTLWRVLAAPWYQIVFRDGYIGDLLTSLVRVLVPLCSSVAFVAVSMYAWMLDDRALTASLPSSWWRDTELFHLYLVPFVTLLPLWLRLVQCLRRSVESGQRWPHMGNALKYTSAISVIAYGTFQPSVRLSPVWITAFVFATLFQFSWDLTQDWGVLQITLPYRRVSGHDRYDGDYDENFLEFLGNIRIELRERRLLGPLWVYLVVIVGNLVLRFAWTLTLLPAVSRSDGSGLSPLYISFMAHLGPIIAAGEILRRMVWGFLRLEWEQIEVLARKVEASDRATTPPLVEESEDEAIELGDRNDSKLKSVTSETLDWSTDDGFASGSFEKMEVTTSAERNGRYSLPRYQQSHAPLLLEADWSQLCCPAFVSDMVASSRSLNYLKGYEQKLRFVEAVIFASAVLYVIVCAAWPAFRQNAT